jgi:hypothetical protein
MCGAHSLDENPMPDITTNGTWGGMLAGTDANMVPENLVRQLEEVSRVGLGCQIDGCQMEALHMRLHCAAHDDDGMVGAAETSVLHACTAPLCNQLAKSSSLFCIQHQPPRICQQPGCSNTTLVRAFPDLDRIDHLEGFCLIRTLDTDLLE